MAAQDTYQLRYVDSGGEQSERLISNVMPDGVDMISAHCHLRNAQRSFHLLKALRLLDMQTGEVIDDPWTFFGVPRGSDLRSLLPLRLIPALRALKYLALSLRGIPRKREYDRLALLVRQASPSIEVSDADLLTGLKKLWVSSEEDYRADLAAIPEDLRNYCRQIAIALAKGSGRRPVNPAVYDRINLEFPAQGESTWAGEVWPPLYEEAEPNELLETTGASLFDEVPGGSSDAPPSSESIESAESRKIIHIDPKAYFGSWEYAVRPELWIELGVEQREYVDRPKTKALRDAAKAAGETDKKRLSAIKSMYRSYVVTEPPQFAFNVGSIYYHQSKTSAVQVAVDDDGLEVHLIENRRRVRAFHITPDQLASWLQTDIEPTDARITRNQSKSEIWKYLIEPDEESTSALPSL